MENSETQRNLVSDQEIKYLNKTMTLEELLEKTRHDDPSRKIAEKQRNDILNSFDEVLEKLGFEIEHSRIKASKQTGNVYSITVKAFKK